MERYKLTYISDITARNLKEATIWEDNMPYANSVRNIVFTQDRSAVDKLTFTINADSPFYYYLESRMDRVIRLYIDEKFFDFFIIIIDDDKLEKEKSITCASATIIMDWSPIAMINGKTYSGGVAFPPNPSNRSAGGHMVEIGSEATYFWQENTLINVGSFDNKETDAPIYDYRIPNDMKYKDFYSTVKNDILEVTGSYVKRRESVWLSGAIGKKFSNYYDVASLEWLYENADVIEVDNVESILEWKESEDLTQYYTHALIYKEQDSEKPTNTKKVAVRSKEEQVKYGQRYIVSSVDSTTFDKATTNAIKAVQASTLKTSTMSLNPASIEKYNDIEVAKVIHVKIDSLGIDKKFFIIEYAMCIDNPLQSKIVVDEIESIENNSVVTMDDIEYCLGFTNFNIVDGTPTADSCINYSLYTFKQGINHIVYEQSSDLTSSFPVIAKSNDGHFLLLDSRYTPNRFYDVVYNEEKQAFDPKRVYDVADVSYFGSISSNDTMHTMLGNGVLTNTDILTGGYRRTTNVNCIGFWNMAKTNYTSHKNIRKV